MKPTHTIKEVRLGSISKMPGCPELAVKEGDIILDKSFGFEVLPAAMDFTKPITRKKMSNAPEKKSERLLRIKKLGEDFAVVAVLHQETYIEGADTLVTTEDERPVTVEYGESFSVYAKQQIYDAPQAVVYEFVIQDKSKPKEQKFCTECGVKLMSKDKFCRECGTPVVR